MKKTLYLGTDPAHFRTEGEVVHFPVINIVSRPLDETPLKMAYDGLSSYTHLVFTSKNAVRIFVEHLALLGIEMDYLKDHCIVAIGSVTSALLAAYGLPPQYVAQEETQEGMIALFDALPLENAHIFLPRSSRSRPVLMNFFHQRNIRYHACDLYDTVTHFLEPVPDLDQIDEIVFTSPSTVSAFIEIFGQLPVDKKLIALGPITKEALKNFSADLYYHRLEKLNLGDIF